MIAVLETSACNLTTNQSEERLPTVEDKEDSEPHLQMILPLKTYDRAESLELVFGHRSIFSSDCQPPL